MVLTNLILGIINQLNYFNMRNLFLKPASLLFGMLILVSSCATIDELNEEQLVVTETFDYQKFYNDYKSEIHNLNREEFAGLNVNLRLLALQDFSSEKKYDWWMEKMDNTMKLESLTKEQVDFVRTVKEMFNPKFYDKDNEEKYDLVDFVEMNAYKIGIDNELISKIFMELNDLDTDLNLINSSPRWSLATPTSAKTLRIDNDNILVNYAKPTDPIGTGPNCQNYSCWFCSPIGDCDCTTNCTYVPNACGIYNGFDCHATCCP